MLKNLKCSMQRAQSPKGFDQAKQLLISTARVVKDPESLRPTAHWENEDDYYGDSIVWCCSACKDRFILEDGTPEENNYEYCPHCGARMVNTDEKHCT